MVVGLILSVALAAPSSSYVVLSKRSGVATPRALEVVAEVHKRLAAAKVPVAEIADASKCNGKKVCLINLGRQKNAVSMVLIELGAVGDEAIARVEAMAVEEDGRSLGVVKHEGSVRTLADDLATKVSSALLQPLRDLHGIKDPEPLVAPPVVQVEPPPPMPPLISPAPQEPMPAPLVEKPAELVPQLAVSAPAKPMSGARIAAVSLGAAGVGTLVGALVEGLRSGGYAKQRDALCGAAVPCTDRYGVANANASAQTGQAAIILTVVGGGLVAAAALVFIVDSATSGTQGSASVALMPLPGGGVLNLTAQF